MLLPPACPAVRGLGGGWGRTRKFWAEFLVANESRPEWMETGDMAASGPALCLFDVDGTLTAPRQVGGVRRGSSGGLRPSGCSERWGGAEKRKTYWKTRFGIFTACAGFEAQPGPLASHERASVLSPANCTLCPNMKNIGVQVKQT